jgi:hypothetical protein
MLSTKATDDGLRIYVGEESLAIHDGSPMPSLPSALALQLLDDLDASDPDLSDPRGSFCYCVTSTMAALANGSADIAEFERRTRDRVSVWIQWDRAFRLHSGPQMGVERAVVDPLVNFLAAGQPFDAAWKSLPLNYAQDLDGVDQFGRVAQLSTDALMSLTTGWSTARVFAMELLCEAFAGQSISLIILWCANKLSSEDLAHGIWCFWEEGASSGVNFELDVDQRNRINKLERLRRYIEAWDSHGDVLRTVAA